MRASEFITEKRGKKRSKKKKSLWGFGGYGWGYPGLGNDSGSSAMGGDGGGESRNFVAEGGNIWKDDLATIRINRADVVPTVQWLEQVTGLELTDNMLGSTGRKDTSGDLDLAVDATKVDKNALQQKLAAWANANDPSALTKKTGVSVHFRTPIKGDPKNGYVQTDFMFMDDIPFAKWSMAAPASAFKGAHKHLVLASVAKSQGLKWSFKDGLSSRSTGDALRGGKDPDYVAKILFGPNANGETISTVENMLAALKNDPERDIKLADAREALAKEGIKI